MKKTFILAAICSCFFAPKAFSQAEKLTPEDLVLIESPLAEEISSVPQEELVTIFFDEVRPLTEINLEDNADAYPWLSPDGLRLYFTQEVGSLDALFFVSRPDVRSPFGKKQLVPIEHEGAKYSAWLSADELEIYYIFRGDDSGLYHGVRTHRDMPFNQIKKVDLGADFQVLNGPSLTPDGKYLMLRIVDTDGLFMLFEKEGEDRFKMVQELPLSFETSPGQLSKDGNKLIVPCDDGSPQKGLFSFCLMEKSNPNDAGFDKSTYVKIKTPGVNLLSITQPSLSADEKVMVFVGGNSSSWDDNNLYIATNFSELEDVMADAKDSKNFSLSVPTPNPAKDFTTVTYLLPKKEAPESFITLLNQQGQEVRRFELSGDNTGSLRMDIAGLAEGVYVCKLVTPLRFSESRRLIILSSNK